MATSSLSYSPHMMESTYSTQTKEAKNPALNLENYYQKTSTYIRFNKAQASRFAKQVAGDFNPIHDSDARHFCVPGDLLFSVLLQQYGLFKKMNIEFTRMVTEKSHVIAKKSPGGVSFVNETGTPYITSQHSMGRCKDLAFVEALTHAYVGFSSQVFPHILIPMMKEQNVMLNPSRPLVVYRKIALTLNKLSGNHISLDYKGAQFCVDKRKGEAELLFDIKDNGTVIGSGSKSMILGGLRPFDQIAIDKMIAEFNQWKAKASNV